jgi:hypothetical protein
MMGNRHVPGKSLRSKYAIGTFKAIGFSNGDTLACADDTWNDCLDTAKSLRSVNLEFLR